MRFLTHEFQFFKTKSERLELAVLSSRPSAASNYVARTDEAARPPITDVEGPKKLDFKTLRSEWDKLSPDEQEKHMKNRDWEPEKTKGAN